jgi:hypothetical protein
MVRVRNLPHIQLRDVRSFGFIAKNYGGDWLPESHPAPGRRLVNPSVKSGYYKR